MTQFKIENMTCGGCARSVTATVKNVDAAAVVNIDVAKKIVELDSQKLDDVLKALAEDGFPAQQI
jgi:copper chaperone